jgi:hypothetical protein
MQHCETTVDYDSVIDIERKMVSVIARIPVARECQAAGWQENGSGKSWANAADESLPAVQQIRRLVFDNKAITQCCNWETETKQVIEVWQIPHNCSVWGEFLFPVKKLQLWESEERKLCHQNSCGC